MVEEESHSTWFEFVHIDRRTFVNKEYEKQRGKKSSLKIYSEAVH
jgi:hypothetical protein